MSVSLCVSLRSAITKAIKAERLSAKGELVKLCLSSLFSRGSQQLPLSRPSVASGSATSSTGCGQSTWCSIPCTSNFRSKMSSGSFSKNFNLSSDIGMVRWRLWSCSIKPRINQLSGVRSRTSPSSVDDLSGLCCIAAFGRSDTGTQIGGP